MRRRRNGECDDASERGRVEMERVSDEPANVGGSQCVRAAGWELLIKQVYRYAGGGTDSFFHGSI